MGGGGFKGHGEGGGGRLGRQVGLGAVGMARRYGVAVDEAGVVAERVGAARAAVARLAEAIDESILRAPDADIDEELVSRSKSEGVRNVSERGTGGDGAIVKRGRPRVGGERPWAVEGVSRAAWYRRRKDG